MLCSSQSISSEEREPAYGVEQATCAFHNLTCLYRNEVEIPPLGFVDDILSVAKFGYEVWS